MSLQNLTLQNFRNYKTAKFHFDPGVTIFTGTNGIGKTSILEAISLLGSTRSFRIAKNEDFISKGEESATLVANVHSQGLENELKLTIRLNGKSLYQNQKLVRKLQSAHPTLPSIVFSPGDHRIVEGDSSDRKQFLNRAICTVNWEYAETLSKFNQVLLQRNQLLKRVAEQSPNSVQTQLDVWDEQFFSLGISLMRVRHQYLRELEQKINLEYKKIAQKNELFSLQYLPLGEDFFDADFSDLLLDKWKKRVKDSLRRDLIVGTTSAGPHKDEILLTLNGNKVKFYGSQGEKRTCALALRLGEVALFREKMNSTPVLLIDDVSSELDSYRRHALVELLKQEDAQVLMTATELPMSLMEELDRSIIHWDLMNLGENKHGSHRQIFQ
jgi:DNA replication and repair protein RecF